ncbi:MAG: glycosyltransferase [candidate division KSB1 bacterium]|nr:glycosyltransferase [candidate division KSB1 bacterium]MDZ7368462.1 glycosyltransferase [candidate division KSB1 bacterium]MDZ7406188.1 glycosyltransferase [candidate division KSB1 bacterium]
MKIIFFSEIKWQYLRTRKQQLIRRFPADWQILFLEPYAAGRPNSFRLQWDNNVCFVTLPYFKNFPQRWLQMIVSFKSIRVFVIAAAAIWAGVLIRRSGFGKSDLVMISNVYAAPLVRWLAKKPPVIYDCNDNHLGFPLTPKWAEKYFKNTCARADRIVCASQSLAEIIPAEYQNKIVFIGNGVDSDLFLKNSTPAEALAKFRPRPILLYIGAISEWTDFEALSKVAATHPDKMLVLIGPAVPAVQLQMNKLLAFSNVQHLGVVRHDDLPAYLAAADVCLIPLRKNELTRFLNPNKLYEYFAAGKPVVSMALSPDLIALRDHVFLAENADEFAALIEPALATIETRAAERRRLAAANEWQEKAKQMAALIGEVCWSGPLPQNKMLPK